MAIFSCCGKGEKNEEENTDMDPKKQEPALPYHIPPLVPIINKVCIKDPGSQILRYISKEEYNQEKVELVQLVVRMNSIQRNDSKFKNICVNTTKKTTIERSPHKIEDLTPIFRAKTPLKNDIDIELQLKAINEEEIANYVKIGQIWEDQVNATSEEESREAEQQGKILKLKADQLCKAREELEKMMQPAVKSLQKLDPRTESLPKQPNFHVSQIVNLKEKMEGLRQRRERSGSLRLAPPTAPKHQKTRRNSVEL